MWRDTNYSITSHPQKPFRNKVCDLVLCVERKGIVCDRCYSHHLQRCWRAPGDAVTRATEENTKCKMFRLICWSGDDAFFQVMPNFRAGLFSYVLLSSTRLIFLESAPLCRGPLSGFVEVCSAVSSAHLCWASWALLLATFVSWKPAASDPRESGRTVRNYRLSHKNTRHLSKVWMKLPRSLDLDGVCCLSSCAWLSLPCEVRRPVLPALWESSLMMDKMNFSQVL